MCVYLHGALSCKSTWLGDRTGVDLTVISPPHPDGAAALLLGDIGGQDAVAEHSVVEVQVALLLLRQHSNCCRSKHGAC